MEMTIQCADENIKGFLRRQLREYENRIGNMTANERRELRKWVSDGNSPYDNPNQIYTDDGISMDYIQGCRTVEDMRKNPDAYLCGSLMEPDVSNQELPF